MGQGLMPAAPYSPNIAITICTLEIFRVMQLCCPRLDMQVFIHTLCNIHGVPPHPYLGAQFFIAFDVYLAIHAEVDKRTQAAFGRDTPNWRLKNACPCCLYKLEGEVVLHIPLLCTFDGNNSLKHFWRRGAGVGAQKEHHDDCVALGNRYLPHEEVERWAKEGLEELMKGFEPGTGVDNPDDDSCDERWVNMKEDVTTHTYRMYDEMGFFPYLCRHSFLLVAVDMVKSSELVKYSFVITAHLLNILGEVATGYDIRCKFGKMVPWLALFHGDAHCRCCQLQNLTTYVEGVGLEDLEECESFFSKSNTLASTTQYSTVFHRQQAITTYLKHADTVDTYQGLFKLLISPPVPANKYRQALKIKAMLPMLRKTMVSLGVEARSVFETWLEKEKMSRLNDIRANGLPFMEVAPGASYSAAAGQMQQIETQRWHATEMVSKMLATMPDLELWLGITKRWERDGAEWTMTALMITNHHYQCTLNELEGLVVAWMFELSKVHMADTGYKLWKHIAKALQARSKGVRSALNRYNNAAVMLSPPRTQLSWEQIIEYTFLADFDLLQEGREDIRSEPWVQPAGHVAMDQHYKLLYSMSKIPHLITYMVDKEWFLVYHEGRLQAEGKQALAHQVKVQRVDRVHFSGVHMEQLTKLSKEEGFTASLSPGVSISKEHLIPKAVLGDSEDVEMQGPSQHAVYVLLRPDEEDEDDDEDTDIDGKAIADAFEVIVRIMHDGPAPVPAL
ncbi:hypothetical protein B0H14DRAFT_3084169 [Mycena olivaceomarginata]|nr:hypothetical protein B0H14DRAFT_3084169 [Mycena olivaceomarginata]